MSEKLARSLVRDPAVLGGDVAIEAPRENESTSISPV